MIPLVLNFGEDTFSGPWDHRFFDPGFGLGLHPQDFHKALPRYQPEKRSGFRRDYRQIEVRDTAPKPRQHIGKEGFQACVDVHHFAPNEVTVKTLDRAIVIEGQHEEREDRHGYISRRFTRRYVLPDDYDVKEVVATLSCDGVLTVKAPPLHHGPPDEREKIIHIHQTGPALSSTGAAAQSRAGRRLSAAAPVRGRDNIDIV